MVINKKLNELTLDEYNELIEISKTITEHLVDVSTKENVLTWQTAMFAYCLGGLVFFDTVADSLKIDKTDVKEQLLDCITQLADQMHTAEKSAAEEESN